MEIRTCLKWMLILLLVELNGFAVAMDKKQCQRQPGLHYVDNDCIGCSDGTYNDGTVTDGCAKCTGSNPGFYIEQNCTTETNTIVKRCPNGTFSLGHNMTHIDCIHHEKLIPQEQCEIRQFETNTEKTCNCGSYFLAGIGVGIVVILLTELFCIVILYCRRSPCLKSVLKTLFKAYSIADDPEQGTIDCSPRGVASIHNQDGNLESEQDTDSHLPLQASDPPESPEMFNLLR